MALNCMYEIQNFILEVYMLAVALDLESGEFRQRQQVVHAIGLRIYSPLLCFVSFCNEEILTSKSLLNFCLSQKICCFFFGDIF